ncbi:MAG TPA: biotin/lipoyl-containing protein, partial [Usitatibacter sp.]|nr:biotin/lipoyl-containing protein [Usitatibacter sp.]
MATIELRVPDIGDFKDVPVIEVLVKPGDEVKKEDSLVTLESDKATMEVPASHAGRIKELRVKVGDKVSQGTVIATLESADEAAAPAKPASAAKPPAAVAPAQPATQSTAGAAAVTPAQAGAQSPSVRQALASTLASLDADMHAEVLVLGAGPGGYTAAFRAADLGKKVILV